MPHELLEEGVTSDVSLRVWAASLDQLFTDAADAALEVMVESPEAVHPRTVRPLELEASALDLLLMKLIDEIVFHKDAEGLFLRATELHVTGDAGHYRLSGALRGEPIDASRHRLAGDIKGTTVHGLRVERTGTGWEATVTLDV